MTYKKKLHFYFVKKFIPFIHGFNFLKLMKKLEDKLVAIFCFKFYKNMYMCNKLRLKSDIKGKGFSPG